jgi:hypothetical protein
MYADLILFTEPKRPLINPQFDLFAWITTKIEDDIASLFPARIVTRVRLKLPEKCRRMKLFPDDIWDFITWQVEEEGYYVVRSIDDNWFYWSVIAEKWRLHQSA